MALENSFQHVMPTNDAVAQTISPVSAAGTGISPDSKANSLLSNLLSDK